MVAGVSRTPRTTVLHNEHMYGAASPPHNGGECTAPVECDASSRHHGKFHVVDALLYAVSCFQQDRGGLPGLQQQQERWMAGLDREPRSFGAESLARMAA